MMAYEDKFKKIEIFDIPQETPEDILMICLENKYDCYEKISLIDFNSSSGKAIISTNNVAIAEQIIKDKSLECNGNIIRTREVFSNGNEQTGKDSCPALRTVQLKGNFDNVIASKKIHLSFYVESGRNNGGDIDHCDFDISEPVVTFTDAAVARAFTSQNHEFEGMQFKAVLMEGWPKPDGCCAIEVEMSEKTSEECLLMILENHRHGGREKHIEDIFMKDSLKAVVTFESHEDVKNIMKATSGKIEIECKMILRPLKPAKPPIYVEDPDTKKLLFLELSHNSLSDITNLKEFIEKCSKTTVCQLFFCPKPDRVLAQFEKEPDYNHVVNVLCCKPFQGNMISVQRLAKANKIQVLGWKDSVTMLTCYFEYKMKGKANVKDVSKCDNDIFVVTFDNTETVESILSRSRYEFDNKCFFVAPYVEELGVIPKDFDPQTPPSLTPERIIIPIMKEIYGFLLENEKYKDSVANALNKLHCTIEWPDSVNNLNVTLSWNGELCHLQNSKCWSSEVMQCFKDDIEKYDYFELELDDSVFDFVKPKVKEFRPGRDKLLIKIDSNCKKVCAVGLEEYVQNLKKLIHENMDNAKNVKEQLIRFKDYEYFLVVEASLKNINKKYNIRISENRNNCSISLVGQVKAVKDCQVELEGLKGRIEHDDVDWLGQYPDFLDFLTKDEVLERVKEEFRSQNILATLIAKSGNLSLYSFFDIKRGQKCLQDMFAVSSLKLESNQQEAMKCNEWNVFKNGLVKQFKNDCRIVQPVNSDSVHVLSFSKCSKQIMGELENYFNTHSKIIISLKMPTAIVEFLKDSNEVTEIKAKASTKGVEVKVNSNLGDQSGFQLFGERSKLASIKDGIEFLCSKVIKKSFQMDGKVKNLFSPKSSNVLMGIISKNKVYINLNLPKSSAGSTPVEHQNVKLFCEINIISGSIAQQNSDVIFNCCSSNLQYFNSSAISKALLNVAGQKLEEELKKVSNELLLPGEVVETSGYKLKCKKVYHGCIASWNKDNSECLKTLAILISNSLEKANQDKIASISFPAFGTGKRGIPYQLVAHEMIHEAVSFAQKPSSLKEINFVIYEDDELIFKAFQAELESRTIEQDKRGSPVDATSSGDDDNDDDTVMESKNVCLKVLKKDMLVEECDAIVNSTNTDFKGGAMSREIMNKAGEQVEKECKELGSLTKGFAVTGSGNMSNCKHIFYASGKYAADWEKTISNILEKANQMGLKNIAMPLLGTGQKKVTIGEIAEVFVSCFTKFSTVPNPSLRTIMIMIPSDSMYSQFFNSIQDVKNRGGSNSNKQRGNYINNDYHGKSVEIEIYGMKENNIIEAHKAILEECKKVITEAEIPHSLKNFKSSYLTDIAKKYDIDIRVSQNAIRLSGTSDISEAIKDVNEILKKAMVEEFNSNKLQEYANYVTWSYTTNDGKVVTYGLHSTGKLENSYQKQEASLKFTDKGRNFHHVDLKTMNDVINGTDSVKVKRAIKGSSTLPDHWKSMPESTIVELVTLNATSNEYLDVQKLFHLGSLKPIIVKIERIQNPSLYKQYDCKRSDMEVKNRLKEVRVWHGTSPTSIPNINAHNFNRALSNQGSFGVGCYFAINPDYSIQSYCRKDATSGLKSIYLAKVLVGKVTNGVAGLKEPPIMDATTGDRFDSVTDNSANPSMYVIFYDCQMYPEYLITFQ